MDPSLTVSIPDYGSWFISTSYLILFREALRHQKMIKAQQLPQEEVERFVKESKALKTTVLIVSTVNLCFLPMPFGVLITASVERWYHLGLYKIIYVPPYIRTFAMLNSLFNLLIYCWRQKEMRTVCASTFASSCSTHNRELTQTRREG